MEMIFSLAEIKVIQSYHRVFKSFSINQSDSSITYREIFIFFDINQSESSFNGHGVFNKTNDNQSELSMLLVTLFVGNQPIRIHHFLKVNCLSFLLKP